MRSIIKYAVDLIFKGLTKLSQSRTPVSSATGIDRLEYAMDKVVIT